MTLFAPDDVPARSPASTRRFLYPLVFAVLIGLFTRLLASAPPEGEPPLPTESPSLPLPNPADRILILAPHPDDETLSCGGLIQKALRRGARVRVVEVTSGDAFSVIAHRLYPDEPFSPSLFLRLGEIRMQETRRALSRLGLPSSQVTFLGYPDSGLHRLLSTHWSRPWRATRTQAIRPPYNGAGFRNSLYTGESLLNDLTAILRAERPTVVYYPHPGDFNQDHRSVAAFTLMALNRLNETPGWTAPREASYLIHGGERWPWPAFAMTGAPQRLPLPMRRLPEERWRSLSLDSMESRRKRAAILDHRSQHASLRPAQFLNSFARGTETFSTRTRSRPTPEGAVLLEPAEPVRSPAFDGAADLVQLQVIAGNRWVRIRSRLQARPSPQMRCRLEIRTLEPEGRTRWMSMEGTPADRSADGGSCGLVGNAIVWKIPRERLGNAHAALVSVSVVSGRRPVDRTAWTLWSLSYDKGKRSRANINLPRKSDRVERRQ
ncbi:MAG: PIG-L family deacetylase [Armatimonadetes bacterium]|nr:PIG-L family deacetylase [Armatimonadota bacterium]